MKDYVGKFLEKKRINEVLPHVEGYLLDVCCGSNELVKKYHQNGIGVDIKQWGNVDKVVEKIDNLPFHENTFDTITILASLNYIPNRKNALLEINRVLKDSGKLVITMIPPKISKIWHYVRESWDEEHSELIMKKGQIYGLTDDSLMKLLIDTGFKRELKKKFMIGLNNLTIAKKNK